MPNSRRIPAHFWGTLKKLSHLFSAASSVSTALSTLDTVEVWRSSRHGPTIHQIENKGSRLYGHSGASASPRRFIL